MAEPDIGMTAAELALGLIEGQDRAVALRRVLAEPGFAAEVEWWRGQFALLFDLWPAASPGPHVAERINTTLDAGMMAAPTVRRLAWPALAAVSSAIAACLLLFILVDPRPNVPVSQPVPVARPASLLVATLDAGEAGPVAAAFDSAARSLRIAAAPRVDADRVAQLWAIGGDGVPHPLALLGRAPATLTLTLTAADRGRLVAGAVLAISVEPKGGSPTGLPTGPVIAKGVLARI